MNREGIKSKSRKKKKHKIKAKVVRSEKPDVENGESEAAVGKKDRNRRKAGYFIGSLIVLKKLDLCSIG